MYVRPPSPGYQAQGLDVTLSGRVITQDARVRREHQGLSGAGYESTESGRSIHPTTSMHGPNWSMMLYVEGQGDEPEFDLNLGS